MYNETYIRVMPRDESHLFSFWEIAPDAYEKIREKHPDVSPTSTALMRIYEVRKRQNARAASILAEEIALDKNEQSRYIPTPENGGTWRVEIGMKTSSGTYVELCRSEEVTLPAVRRNVAEGRGFDFSPEAEESLHPVLEGYLYKEDEMDKNDSDAGMTSVERGMALSQATSPIKLFAQKHHSSGDG
jgi:hypothetical protein